MSAARDVAATLDRLRQRAPMVHCMTSLVAMDLAANALAAVGASPVMALAEEEVAEIAAASDALTVSLGTIDGVRLRATLRAAETAAAHGKRWVLDPVAVGATRFRAEAAARLIALGPTVVRGNASEILALGSGAGRGRGVDAAHTPDQAEDAARALARRSGSVVAVTGAVDVVTDGDRTARIAYGHPWMARVSGLGCALTGVIGACQAVVDDAFAAAVHALILFGVAGELAAAEADGPGSFRIRFLDALDRLDGGALGQRVRVA